MNLANQKLVIASNNQGKIKEIKEIFDGIFQEILSLKDINLEIDVEETGSTFAENAMIKAKAISEITNCVVLSDDSGLCVNALDYAPGVYSARYSGTRASDLENNKLLLENMQNITDRRAYFESSVVLYFLDGNFIEASGRVYGKILNTPKGTNGFGYDSLFNSDELDKSFGEASGEEKNLISHRARALNLLKVKLYDRLKL